MARPNPKYETLPDPSTTDPPFWGIFTGVFGQPTEYQTSGTDVKTVLQTPVFNVPQNGAQAQGGCRGQTCNNNDTKTSCYSVYGNDLQLTQASVDYYRNIGVDISKCGTVTPVNGNLEQRVKELEQLSWTYPEVIGTASQRSNVDIWNHLSQWVWGHGGEKWQAGGSAPKWDQPEPTALLPLTLSLHANQEQRLSDAKAHRDSIETKVEDLYTGKSEKGHKHNGGGGTNWGTVVLGILAIIIILIIMKYVFPLLGGLKGIFKRGGNGNDSMYSRN